MKKLSMLRINMDGLCQGDINRHVVYGIYIINILYFFPEYPPEYHNEY